MPARTHSQQAIRSVRVTIDANGRDAYVGQLKAFARAFHFIPYLSQTSRDPNDIVVHMQRDDVFAVSLLASPIGGATPAYEVFFYPTRNQSISPASLDPLVEGLKSHIARVQGALAEEPKIPAPQ